MDYFQASFARMGNLDSLFEQVCTVLAEGHSFRITGINIMRKPLLLWCYYFRQILIYDQKEGTDASSFVLNVMKNLLYRA